MQRAPTRREPATNTFRSRLTLSNETITPCASIDKGTFYDNFLIEFLCILKLEILYLTEFESVAHFKIELEKYITY